MISEFNDNLKIITKKEYIKIFSTMAEIFESSLVEFFPKIL
jgi:hypothetical protein